MKLNVQLNSPSFSQLNVGAADQPYTGEAVSWFKGTSSGRFSLALLNGTGAVLLGIASLNLAVKALVLTLFSGMAIATGIGIPAGLIGLGITATYGAGSLLAFKSAQYFFNNAKYSYGAMQRLSTQE